MKRLLFFLTMMAAVALTSCRREPVNDAENGVGTFVDATFTVALGPETRAYADGTSVNRLYAGIYEVSSPGKFIWVADNADDPASISGKAATVTFTGKLLLGSSYKVVFWAQKEGESFTIDWGRTTTVGLSLTFPLHRAIPSFPTTKAGMLSLAYMKRGLSPGVSISPVPSSNSSGLSPRSISSCQ